MPIRTQVRQHLCKSFLKICRNYLNLCQLHKIISEACPPYVNDLLPLERSDGQYELRNYSKLKLSRICTKTYRKSFLPSSIGLHKDLFPKPNRLFSYGSEEGLVNHARLRMGLSVLNQHRWKYNYKRDTACPSCNHRHGVSHISSFP